MLMKDIILLVTLSTLQTEFVALISPVIKIVHRKPALVAKRPSQPLPKKIHPFQTLITWIKYQWLMLSYSFRNFVTIR